MRAVVCTHAELSVAEVPDPVPRRGQVLLEVSRCGICGSDLHARHHADTMADIAALTGYDDFMRADQQVVMGHEFCGTVLDYGPDTRRAWPRGTLAVALPIVRGDGAVQATGLSHAAPGGYAERVVVEEAMTFPVPNGLPPNTAALTEPMAVALHAVRRGGVSRGQTAVVIGCGPIGLGVILMLKATGVRHVVASDFSPARRALAARCGADVVVDPAEGAPWDRVQLPPQLESAPALFDYGIDLMRKVRRMPPQLPWSRALNAATRMGLGPQGPVVFECVGVPGVLDQLIATAPMRSRIVVVGVCMQPDTIRPGLAVNKELELRFVLAYDPAEFDRTLRMLAEGQVDPSPLHTGTVGLDGVATAFDALADPETHAKILVDPTSDAVTP